MLGQHLDDRQLRDLVLRLDRLEGRRLLEPHADEEADADEQDREQERNAPGPAQELALRQLRHQREDADGREIADRDCRPAPGCRRSRDASAGAFSTTIRTAPPHSPPRPMPCSRRSSTRRMGAAMPIWLVGRQAADQEGADAHDDDGQRQHLLAADLVAEMAEDGRAERAREEADRVGARRPRWCRPSGRWRGRTAC